VTTTTSTAADMLHLWPSQWGWSPNLSPTLASVLLTPQSPRLAAHEPRCIACMSWLRSGRLDPLADFLVPPFSCVPLGPYGR